MQNNPNEDDANKISKKKLKKLTRLSVAQLKQVRELVRLCSYLCKPAQSVRIVWVDFEVHNTFVCCTHVHMPVIILHAHVCKFHFD